MRSAKFNDMIYKVVDEYIAVYQVDGILRSYLVRRFPLAKYGDTLKEIEDYYPNDTYNDSLNRTIEVLKLLQLY